MNAAFAPSSARRYENNWTRFVTFVQKLDRKRRYMPASPNTVIAFVQHLKNEGKAPNTIRTFLSAISERHKACRYPDPTNDYLVAKTVKGVAHACPHVDQRQPLSTRDLSIIIKSVPTSRCSSYTVILLRAMFSLMFFWFLRIGEVTASPHNLSVSQCRIKPSKLRLVFQSYKHSAGCPFTLDVLPTGKAACPYRRMVDYIKLRGHDQGPLFRYANKLPVQKTAFAKYLKAIIANTELTSKKISPHCFRIGAATWAAKSGFSSEQIKAMGRWHSNSYQKYIRVVSISSKPSA